jgi:DUF971 family protein
MTNAEDGPHAEDALWPTDLNFNRGERQLEISFNTGDSYALPFELLRVESPSAEVQGHGAEQKKLVSGKQQVNVVRAEPTGNYAVRLVFDDGHDSGIFTWDYLAEMGRNLDKIQATYIAALAEQGLARG